MHDSKHKVRLTDLLRRTRGTGQSRGGQAGVGRQADRQARRVWHGSGTGRDKSTITLGAVQ